MALYRKNRKNSSKDVNGKHHLICEIRTAFYVYFINFLRRICLYVYWVVNSFTVELQSYFSSFILWFKTVQGKLVSRFVLKAF